MFEGTPPFNTGWEVVHGLIRTSMDFEKTVPNLYALNVGSDFLKDTQKVKNTIPSTWQKIFFCNGWNIFKEGANAFSPLC